MHVIARRASRRFLTKAVPVAAALLLAAAPAAAQPELQDWQWDELRPLEVAVTAAIEGDIIPQENPFSLAATFIKATDGFTYVPFTLTLDPETVGDRVAVYLHVHDPEDTSEEDEDLPSGVFREGYWMDAEPSADGQVRISRAFNAPGGSYDIYVAVRDSPGEDGDREDNPSVLLLRESVDVPDFWTPDLNTSSILVAEGIEPLAAPLTEAQQIERPYALGAFEIRPKHPPLNFTQSEEFAPIFFVYNAGVEGGSKPNVTIEFAFHRATEEGEEFFNRTSPQEFNGQTLPPDFDLTLGHQIVAGQQIPLSSFPAGDYRLEITVTDNAAGTALTRNVPFSVEQS